MSKLEQLRAEVVSFAMVWHGYNLIGDSQKIAAVTANFLRKVDELKEEMHRLGLNQ